MRQKLKIAKVSFATELKDKKENKYTAFMSSQQKSHLQNGLTFAFFTYLFCFSIEELSFTGIPTL